jgi:CheY-like chemotaxis protein
MASEQHHVNDGVKVLVVDDDTAIREVLRLVLEDEGYSVVEADNGAEALALLRQSAESQVVVADHLMPILDGPGLVNAIAADPEVRDRIALVYITAANRMIPPALAARLNELGAPVIWKPFQLDVFLGAVARAAKRLAHGDARQGDAASP